MAVSRPVKLLMLLVLALCCLALARRLDHDESQYVAAAVLSADGWLPYRDYAYLQTPLQPLLFAPVAALAGAWAWPALRIVNALLGAATVWATWYAARTGGANERAATAAAMLFASCDILLFSAGTARNDALPAALLAAALIPLVAASRGRGTKRGAALAGLLLAAAAAAKASYALPALAYGGYALWDRRHHPLSLALGALPPAVLVAALWAAAPGAFVFDVVTFPINAPAEFYRSVGKAWKLTLPAKIIDTTEFLLLGPALLALVTTIRTRWRDGQGRALDVMLIGGMIAALAPEPTWRQYLLPVLPPLFVRTALGWSVHPPRARLKVAAALFALAGITPSIVALAKAWPLPKIVKAVRAGRAAGDALDRAGIVGPVATLAPQFLPAARRSPDRRFAAGPFYFRSSRLLRHADERGFHLVSRARIDDGLAVSPPRVILLGGEGRWTKGNAEFDVDLERWAVARGYRVLPTTDGRLRLYVSPAERRAAPPRAPR